MFFKYFLIFLLLIYLPLSAFEILNQVNKYGWLDQYSFNTEHHFIGDEACVPTSSTNGMTYLQNAVPFIFDSSLSGTTYSDWKATGDYLIRTMGTTADVGTYYYQFVYALNDYITVTKGFSEVQFSGMFPNDNWDPAGGYPQPNYITSGRPNIEFLTNAIAAGSAVLISIEYTNGNGGHEILANGLDWDTSSQTGTLYFVDPLDPSQNYSPDVPTGPVKQTVGELSLDNAGRIILTYDQYSGTLPYTDTYDTVRASFYGLLSVGGGAFTPFSELVVSGNGHKIAEGFDLVDPTTSSMFPIMAILNTSSGAN